MKTTKEGQDERTERLKHGQHSGGLETKIGIIQASIRVWEKQIEKYSKLPHESDELFAKRLESSKRGLSAEKRNLERLKEENPEYFI